MTPPVPRAKRLGRSVVARLTGLFRTRGALGLDPAAVPIAFFVPLGALLGPELLGFLTVDVLAHLDVAVSVALATLGVFVGMALGRQTVRVRPILVCASIESGTTLLVVTAASLVLVRQWGLPLDASPLATAIMLGLCASVSSVPPQGGLFDSVRQVLAEVADLDDVAPILVAAVVVAALREPELLRIFQLGLATLIVGVAMAMAGWLLFEVASGAAERGVYVIGVLVMLGGSAAYLSLSPLLTGLVAGLFWTRAPGRADKIIDSDLRKVQHPLVVLLLLTAGASLRITPLALWLLAPYMIFRLAGKLAGSWLAARLAPGVVPAELGASLIWPGIVAIAFALNFQQVVAPVAGTAVLSAVALGCIASEILALFLMGPGPVERA